MLKDKVAVITGGTRGIGKAIAQLFAANGASVAVIGTSYSDKAKETVEELEKVTTAKFYSANVKDAEDCDNVVKSILEDFGKIDILVNNAGITKDGLLMSMKQDQIDDVIDINLKGTMYMTKACIRNFVKLKGGSVINISSVVGIMGNVGQANYSASKAGIIGFTKSVAKEYAKKGLRCNAIAPGFIMTDMTEAMTDDAKSKLMEQIPLQLLGQPEDVAKAALFLASDMSSYITGEVIRVDGGMAI